MVDQGLVKSRSQAKALIMADLVRHELGPVEKAGQLFYPETKLFLKNHEKAYVSRGGYKLEGALKDFQVDLNGQTCLDVGASTGGFTDCLLKHGASHVTALDVGYGQLAWSLRQDSRVRVMDRTNARYVTPEMFDHLFGLVVVDVSFISLKLILPKVKALLDENGKIISLVKPQFEVGKGLVGRGGVVKDKELISQTLDRVSKESEQAGFNVLGRTPAKIKGPKGNQEFFLLLTLSV